MVTALSGLFHWDEEKDNAVRHMITNENSHDLLVT